MVNGGFGLRLALVNWKCVIIWWCVCGALLLTYAVVSIVTYRWKSNRKGVSFGNAVEPGNSRELDERPKNYEMTSSSGEPGLGGNAI